ncbi:hypothetical protein SUGI_0117470 [Cryptomeria japonica]|nr:hypothetical protein SUGI_0117470 [Cryptomeria japonica]
MAMPKRAIPVVSVAAALILSQKHITFCACEPPAKLRTEKVKEPFTGVEFPRLKEDYVLLGTAVRCMLGQCKFAKARAYAVGLYLEDGNNLHQCINKNSNDEVFKQVIEAPVARRLVLVMDKDVAGHHIAKGFDRSLLPCVRKAQGGQRIGPGKDALREFTHCFNQEKMLYKGTEVSLVWRPDDSLIISINSSTRAISSNKVESKSVNPWYHSSIQTRGSHCRRLGPFL